MFGGLKLYQYDYSEAVIGLLSMKQVVMGSSWISDSWTEMLNFVVMYSVCSGYQWL